MFRTLKEPKTFQQTQATQSARNVFYSAQLSASAPPRSRQNSDCRIKAYCKTENSSEKLRKLNVTACFDAFEQEKYYLYKSVLSSTEIVHRN